MNVNHFIADVTGQLADWGVNYSENVAGKERWVHGDLTIDAAIPFINA